MNVSVFRAIGELALGAKGRRDKEYAEFLAFYRDLVETLPSEMIELFGTLENVSVFVSGKKASYGLELSVTDYLWWKQHIEVSRLRFESGVASVKFDMLDRFSRKAETHRLSPEERTKLLALIEQSKAA